jgi:hypothetical protein
VITHVRKGPALRGERLTHTEKTKGATMRGPREWGKERQVGAALRVEAPARRKAITIDRWLAIGT